MRRLWRCLVNGLLVLMMLGVGAPTVAQPEAVTLAASGVYTEDFSTYAAKDYTEDAVWDVWAKSLRLARTDAILQGSANTAVDANGYIVVVWSDYRDNGNSDIYMQRLDPNGNRLWAEDKQINVNGAMIDHYYPVVVVDTDGNATVMWARYDNNQEKWDIYAQRVNVNGTRLWASDMRVNTTQGMSPPYYRPAIALDNNDNVFVVWKGSSIYAQRIDVSGNRLWGEDLSVGGGDYPAMGLDGNGNAMIVWRSGGGWFTNIYAQHVSTTGVLLWADALRINVTQATVPLYYGPGVAVDNSGNAIVVWTDSRRGFNKFDIYAQRVAADGVHIWTEDVLVSDGQAITSPEVVLDTDGSVFVGWGRFVQRLDTGGNRLWVANVQLSEGSISNMVREASGDALVALDCAVGICMQRISANGNCVWTTAQRVSADSGKANQSSPAIATSVAGSTMLAWEDSRDGRVAVYLQKITADGGRLWQQDIQVSDSGNLPSLAMDGNENTVVVWENGGIYMQRIDAQGNRLWTQNVRVSDGSAPIVAVDATGNAAVVYRSGRSIYMQWIGVNGSPLWTGARKVNDVVETGNVYVPAIALDETRHAMVVWSFDGNIYIQRMDVNGDRLWPEDIRLNGVEHLGYNPDIVVDNAGNAIVTWEEGNIYAQRVRSDGDILWSDVVQVNDSSSHSRAHAKASIDVGGNVTVVWEDWRNRDDDIYAQRLNMEGSRLWSSDVCVNTMGIMDQGRPAVAVSDSGDISVAWQDTRNGNSDIYAQRINQIGGKVWLADLQVVYPDMFHFPTGFAQSRSIDTLAADITQATLTADMTLNGGSVQFYLTNDGGAHWAAVTPGVTHVFTTTGSDLRWRAALRGDPLWRHRSPVINSLRIEYSTDAPGGDTYEPDDTCAQAQPLQVNGAAQQHTFHQYQDSDWGWFEARAGVTYTIQTGNTGARADIVLELYDSCGTPPIDEDDNAFGPGATLTFTAPVSGRYYVRVLQVDSSVYGAETEYDLSVRAQQPTGAAIIVAGRLNANDPVQPIINATANLAYQTLLRRGFAADDIYYLNSDTTQPGVDGTPTKAQLRDAVQDWARPRVGLGAPLWLFLADHGNVDRFHNEIAEVVTAEELNLWLSNLEATSGVDQINVILEACFSGSFIDTHQNGGWGAQEISGQGRVVVASTTSRWWAYAPPIVGGRPTPVTYFSGGFWRALGEGQTLWHAFLTGREEVEGVPIGKCGDYAYTCQRPWLDDTGDAWFDTSDGLIAQSRGLATAFAGEIAPYIDWVEVGEIQNGRATLRAQVRDDGSVTRVWARVFAPSFTLPTSTDGSIPVISVPEATLTHSVGDMFTVEYAGFTEPGAYQVVLYALDDEGRTSTPRAVLVGAQKVYLPLVIRQ